MWKFHGQQHHSINTCSQTYICHHPYVHLYWKPKNTWVPFLLQGCPIIIIILTHQPYKENLLFWPWELCDLWIGSLIAIFHILLYVLVQLLWGWCNGRNFVCFSSRSVIVNWTTCYCNFSFMMGISSRCAPVWELYKITMRIFTSDLGL